MNESKIILKKSLGEWFNMMTAGGYRVVGPVGQDGQIDFEPVTSPDAVRFDHVQTNNSGKWVMFPRYEAMMRFRLSGKEVQAGEIPPQAPPTVLFGAHPCDAASLATLNAVFTWDSSDAYFEPKLANTTIIGLSCTKGDSYCFCTSVGGGPGDTRGSDVLLTPLDGEKFLAEILTEKGKSVVGLAPQLFSAADGTSKEAALAKIPARFNHRDVTAKLPSLFPKEDVWKEQSLRCLGCGACAYVCPTCSCFDIQDERDRYTGVRIRCWDSCGFGLFTLHASNHNPRHKQSERWRQRVMHKFSYQPERLNVLGCVGCGRCSRSCPVDMNLGEHVAALAEIKV